MTSNVTEKLWRAVAAGCSDLAVCPAGPSPPVYSSSMCSNAQEQDVAARLGTAIDEVAAAAGATDRGPDDDLAARLAAAWALIAAADPALAERTSRY